MTDGDFGGSKPAAILAFAVDVVDAAAAQRRMCGSKAYIRRPMPASRTFWFVRGTCMHMYSTWLGRFTPPTAFRHFVKRAKCHLP